MPRPFPPSGRVREPPNRGEPAPTSASHTSHPGDLTISSTPITTAPALPYRRPRTALQTGLTSRLSRNGLLFVPLVFFAARGLFSFQSDVVSGGFAPGSVLVRDPGIFGSVLLPGAVYGIVLFLIWSRWPQIRQIALRCKPLMFLALIAPLSALWSQAPSKSLEFGTCYVLDTLFAFYLVSDLTEEELPVLLNRLLLLISIACILTSVLLPSIGTEGADVRFGVAWRGIFDQRGGEARVSMYLLTASLAMAPRFRDRTRTVAIILGLIVLTMAHATSAWMIFAVYLGVQLFQKVNRRLNTRSSTALLLTASGIGVATILTMIFGAAIILPLLGRDPTLTGRTEIWSVAFQSVLKSPFLGYGFYAFWLGLEGESGNIIQRLHWSFGYAHNGMLELTLQLGLLGLGAFLVTFLQAVKHAWTVLRTDRSGRYDWYVALIVLTLIYNIDDCTVVWPKDLLSILYVVACCQLTLAVSRLRRPRLLTPEPSR